MKKYKLIKTSNSSQDLLAIVLHGVSEGCESDFIQLISASLADLRIDNLLFDFNFIEQQKDFDKDTVQDEIDELERAITYAKEHGYKEFILIGKSLGGIVCTSWLERQTEQTGIEAIVIFGFVKGETSLKGLAKAKTALIIQGEKDRYGNKSFIDDHLASVEQTVKVVEIKGGDHSYRNELKEPQYQAAAIYEMHTFLAKSI